MRGLGGGADGGRSMLDRSRERYDDAGGGWRWVVVERCLGRGAMEGDGGVVDRSRGRMGACRRWRCGREEGLWDFGMT